MGERKYKKVVWECLCDCGNTFYALGTNLNKGQTISCGCYKRPHRKNTPIEPGQKYGKLTILKKSDKMSNKNIMWVCECECGKIKDIRGSHLVSGAIKSCGCLNFDKNDLTGQTFGFLTVLSLTDKKGNSGQNIWLCRCECGTLKEVRSTSLRSGEVSSCGCIQSMGNARIKQILNENQVAYKDEYTFDDLLGESNRRLRFDFALLDEKKEIVALIEFQGNQHYYDKPHGYYTEELICKIKKHDKLKKEYCIKHDLNLIEIPYWDYDKLTIDYLKEKINE